MPRAFRTGITVDGAIASSNVISSTQSSGDEGGQLDLAKSVTNTTLTTGVSIDVFQNRLRFFETGGTNRGYYIDISTGGAGVATNLVGGGSASNSFTTIAVPSGTNPVAASSTDTLTLTAGTGISITGTAASDSIAIATNGATANGASTLVLRDASGNFAAGAITATSLVSSGVSFALVDTTATTVTFGGAATSMTIGGATSSTVTIANGATSTVNIANGSGTSTTNIGAGPTNASTRTVNIGATSLSNTSTQVVNIAAASTIVGTNTVNIGASATQDTSILNLYARTTAGGALTLRSGTATANTAPLYFGASSPVVLTTPVTGAVEYDGLAFYKTITATTGRAVDVASYYYVSDGSYGVDHSASATAKPIFGSATTGIVLVAGTTYEVEMSVAVSITTVGTASPGWSHSFLTLAGTATPTYYQEISISTNTTSQATSSTVSRRRVINNATVEVLAAATGGTQRHSIYTVKGMIRVTGTAGTTVEIAPASTASATSADYSFVALNGSYIKLTPVGNGTVTNVGNAWV